MGIYKYPRTYGHQTQHFSYAKSGNLKLTEHFSLGEFRSKDGADEIVICPDLINHCLEQIFHWMPNVKSINITSGYRSIAHSKAIGGAGEKDNHHMGMAVDIKIKKMDGTYYKPAEIACALQDNGWDGGIGLMKTALHIDIGSKYYFDETKKSGGAYVQVADFHAYTGVTTYFGKTAKSAINNIDTPKPATTTKTTSTSKGHRGTPYVITCDYLNVRTRPNVNSLRVGRYYRGQVFYVVAWDGKWCKLESGNWMSAKGHCKKA